MSNQNRPVLASGTIGRLALAAGSGYPVPSKKGGVVHFAGADIEKRSTADHTDVVTVFLTPVVLHDIGKVGRWFWAFPGRLAE